MMIKPSLKTLIILRLLRMICLIIPMQLGNDVYTCPAVLNRCRWTVAIGSVIADTGRHWRYDLNARSLCQVCGSDRLMGTIVMVYVPSPGYGIGRMLLPEVNGSEPMRLGNQSITNNFQSGSLIGTSGLFRQIQCSADGFFESDVLTRR